MTRRRRIDDNVRECEVGAGWKAVSNDGEEYISVKLDDPSFNAPIIAALWPSGEIGAAFHAD
ncbi:Protein of unknown function [Rhizobium miluonense]|uniref:DUF736 domain-containing protein n=1 Tax=Rhizobium miluonense TaxID=411945 RepID=A0A1C3XBC7_9HYPH|nr:Protein of unknown function [Rhizobium miluonense]